MLFTTALLKMKQKQTFVFVPEHEGEKNSWFVVVFSGHVKVMLSWQVEHNLLSYLK